MSAHHHSDGGSPHWTRMELRTMDTKTIRSKSLSEALDDELLETIDEELELEFDDQRLDSVLGPIAPAVAGEAMDRRTYFRELLRLQRELIKCRIGLFTKNSNWSCCSRAATPPARAASSSASPSGSIRVSAR